MKPLRYTLKADCFHKIIIYIQVLFYLWEIIHFLVSINKLQYDYIGIRESELNISCHDPMLYKFY